MEALQPRVSWDRVHNRLHALPGTQQTALVNGGTIPDTGQYAAYTHTGVRIGELDEEFVYERRVGDAFLLGTSAWRVEQIEADRVIVAPAEGAPAMVPFWRGENVGRSHDLGLAVGRFLAEMAGRLSKSDCVDWLEHEYFLERGAARNLLYHVGKQLEGSGTLPTDKVVVVEASRDQLGDWQVILLSPFGSRMHLGLRLAVEAMLEARLGYRPQCLHHDDGLLVRLTDSDEPVLDLLEGLTPDNVESLVLGELAGSALFALRFRQNAARAMLLPRGKPGQRAPLWLQRLRGRDLLQVARKHPDFPVVVETLRECLHDHLDLPRLKQLLGDIRGGEVKVVTQRRELPSPFASGLLFAFTAAFMYQYDGAPGEQKSANLDRDLLEQLVEPQSQAHLLDPRAVGQVERRLRGVGRPPRSAAEMAEWLRRLGDLAPGELEGPMAAFLEELEADGRAVCIELPGGREPVRWVLTEEADLYRRAFAGDDVPADERNEAAACVLERFLATHALVSLGDLVDRYPLEREWAERELRQWADSGRVVPVRPAGDAPTVQWSAPENLEQVQRTSLGLLRSEVLTCTAPQFADFLLRWHGVHPVTRKGTSEGLALTLQKLEGLPLTAELWEQAVLPARVPGYQPRWLDEWVAGGAGAWVLQGEPAGGLLAFIEREQVAGLQAPARPEVPLDEDAQVVLGWLRSRGASFVTDLAMEGRSPSVVRAALWELAGRSLVSNDHFDVVRRGKEESPAVVPARRTALAALRRRAVQKPEGRWSLLPWGAPSPEEHALRMAARLLQRHGVVARELALADPWMPPWRVLYEVLSRLELAGEVRRGYFVEGLSGAQFALPEAVRLLQEQHTPSTAQAPAVLLHSLDPANLYGSGAALDIPLLEGGTCPFVRRMGSWLVLRAGKPVLLVEQQGKKLTALPSASRDDVAGAVGLLPSLCNGATGPRYKLTVEEWNGRPVTTTEGKELLEAAGFVRDYQGMTLFAVWR